MARTPSAVAGRPEIRHTAQRAGDREQEVIVDLGTMAVVAFDMATLVAWVVVIYTVDA